MHGIILVYDNHTVLFIFHFIIVGNYEGKRKRLLHGR